MQKFVCIHGHFYQPPRENPRTWEVEEDETARPFHDWNERITSECYAPNVDSPLLDGTGRILDRVNNYAWISFNFGPTLLRWMESHRPEVHRAIVEADKASADRFGGHGSAMAQVYNHMIMPLANAQDKRTQTRWGVEDFVRRFGRYPEGMWLPETAVDLASLEVLAEAEIKFTVLSPHQAVAVRKNGEGGWTDVSGGRIDTRRAYSCTLPSGRTISLFFYDKGLSTGIAFGNLLDYGQYFSNALLTGFSESDEQQLVNVATDGESYGHHRKNGHLVLTSCLSRMRNGGEASVVNYGLFLSAAPPTHEVRIQERTSWSCVHGVERWRSNCGCGSEIHPGHSQEWRAPLRSSLDWLRDRLSEVFVEEGSRIFTDPIATRDKLLSVALERREEAGGYLRGRAMPRQAADRGAELLEMVECSALMFASCAWFWEDMARMETVQMLRFAARAIELARGLTAVDLQPEFERLLSAAKPNDPRFKDGAELYARLVRTVGPS